MNEIFYSVYFSFTTFFPGKNFKGNFDPTFKIVLGFSYILNLIVFRKKERGMSSNLQ